MLFRNELLETILHLGSPLKDYVLLDEGVHLALYNESLA